MTTETPRDDTAAPTPTATGPARFVKPLVLLALAATAGFVLYQYGGQLDVAGRLADREAALDAFKSEHPVLVYAVAFVVYAVVTGLAIPGAAVMTLVVGWYFGPVAGTILVSFASTTGATISFLLSRYLVRGAIEHRFADRVRAFNEAIEREGAFYLFTLRLVPVFPFFAINVAMGLTRIKLPTYWWVSQLGMLPGTIVYTWAGSTIPSLRELVNEGAGFSTSQKIQLAIAFTLLGVFPIVVKKVLNRFRPPTPATVDDAASVVHST